MNIKRITRGTAAVCALALGTALIAPASPWASAELVQPSPMFAKSTISERDLAAGGGWFYAYTSNSQARPEHFNAWLFEGDSGAKWKLNADGTRGQAGGFSGDTVTFTQRRPGLPRDLFKVVDVHEGAHASPFPTAINTGADEFDPTVSGGKLLFTRYRAGTDTYRVMLYDRQSTEMTTLARATGRGVVRAGQITGDWVTWHRTTPRGADVYRQQLSTGAVEKLDGPAGADFQYNPGVNSLGTVFFHRRGSAEPGRGVRMVMAPVGSPQVVLYRYLQGQDGGRAFARPGGAYFTVTTVSAPAAVSDDTYWISAP